jgi:hypothetical protein
MKTIHFPDLLSEPIVVDDVELDATVEVIVKKEDGHYFIDYLKFPRVYVLVGDHRFELTAEEFTTRHKTLAGRFRNRLELMAFQLASTAEADEVSA